MEVKEVVQLAKKYVADLFSDEKIVNVVLEEIRRDKKKEQWLVTVGFQRRWDESMDRVLYPLPERAYKVVVISDSNGNVESILDRASLAIPQ